VVLTGFDARNRAAKVFVRNVFCKQIITPKQDFVILHRERSQPPVDDARDGRPSRAAEISEGCGCRFSFALRFGFSMFFECRPISLRRFFCAWFCRALLFLPDS
jgi:hypothetical protein